MTRIWNKHKQIHPVRNGRFSNGAGTPLKPNSKRSALQRGRRKVFVGLSGGVDSSVAAYLLKDQGYNVVGVYLLCFSGEDEVCRAEQDMKDARAVARQLGISFYAWNLENEYREKVIDYMVEGYRMGLTPNPDVMCNREIKFGVFMKRALAMGADFVATGHYARKREIKNQKSKIKNYVLASARDLNKDQSYFLWTLTQNQLKRCLFPIGDYLKSDVREIARRTGLKTADKKDSQGICFVGKVRLPDFLGTYIKPTVGQVKVALPNGEYQQIGEHNGAEFYTIGQRHIGMSDVRCQMSDVKGYTKPYYVAEKDISTNTLFVAEGDDNPALYKTEVQLTNVNFICPKSKIINQKSQITVFARVRYRQPLIRARIMNYESPPKADQPLAERIKNESSINEKNLILKFDEPVKFVAPGQSAVFYRACNNYESHEGHELIGGGIIK